jgi:hypothetical protein
MKEIIAIVCTSVLALGGAWLALNWNARVEKLQVSKEVDLGQSQKLKQEIKAKSKDADPTGTAKFVVTNGEEYEFGTMQRGDKRSHTFTLKNEGTAPGIIKLFKTSCKCTLSDELGVEHVLGPGEEKDIGLTWEPLNYSSEFEQGADIITDNDPSRRMISLRIKGIVIQRVRPVPDELIAIGLPVDKPSEHPLKVYAYNDKDFEVTGFKFLRAEEAKLFDVKISPMEPADFADEKGAIGGSHVTLIAKEHLPFGLIRQTLQLKTNLQGEGNLIDVPIVASVQSELEINGSSSRIPFQAGTNQLRFGLVTPASVKEAEARLSLRVKPGASTPEEISIKVLESETFPQGGVIAEISEPRKLGNVVIYNLTIKIAPGQEPISLQGTEGDEAGRVVLETNLESAPRVEFIVRYSFSR